MQETSFLVGSFNFVYAVKCSFPRSHRLHVEQTCNVCFSPQDIDRNKDGLISLDEFLGDYRDPDDKEAEEPEWVKEETKRFNEEYDKNHDGKLDKEEASFTWALLFTGILITCKIRCLVQVFHCVIYLR